MAIAQKRGPEAPGIEAGMLALSPALHAAALEPDLFASVALQNCLASWSSVLSAPMATNQFENVVDFAWRHINVLGQLTIRLSSVSFGELVPSYASRAG